MFSVDFNDANTCASMHLLVEIHNTCSFAKLFNVQKSSVVVFGIQYLVGNIKNINEMANCSNKLIVL